MTAKRKAKTKHDMSQQKQPLNKYPPLIRELIQKHEGNMLAASRAVGRVTAYWLNKFATGTEFDEKAKSIVQKALAGEVVPPSMRGGDNSVRNAILIVRSDLFEKLYDIGITMGGEWKMKTKAGGFWIGVIAMPGKELTPFLALATAKGVESYAT